MHNGPNSSFAEESLVIDEPLRSAERLLTHGWTTLVPSKPLAQLRAAALSAAKRVFALPAERKHSFARPELGGHVGWRGASSDERPEEVWQIPVSDGEQHWPEELQEERRVLNTLGLSCAQITKRVLTALTDLNEDVTVTQRLSTCVSDARTVVRILHYRPSSSNFAFAPHTDFGIATLFAGETAAGLELEEDKGTWIRPNSELVLAAGEILKVCTNRRIKPAYHRVLPVAEERWAVAVFIHPEPDYEIGRDAQGSPITAQAFFEGAMAAYSQEGSSRHPDAK
jgi:isopenicillin N synthase-like dioxygenase